MFGLGIKFGRLDKGCLFKTAKEMLIYKISDLPHKIVVRGESVVWMYFTPLGWSPSWQVWTSEKHHIESELNRAFKKPLVYEKTLYPPKRFEDIQFKWFDETEVELVTSLPPYLERHFENKYS